MFETDALKTALRFIAQLDGRMMTSTASRLAVVQREIDNLAAALNPDPQSRTEHLQRRIADLQQQLDDVQAGRIAELTPEQAVEGIREVYALSSACGRTFGGGGFVARGRPALREAIISARHHRGAVMDQLLTVTPTCLTRKRAACLTVSTSNFPTKPADRDAPAHPPDPGAPGCRTRRWMACSTARCACWCSSSSAKPRPCRLCGRSEREVSQFMKTGQAAENQRVGQLLNDVLEQALRIDWQRRPCAKTRRCPAGRGPGQRAAGGAAAYQITRRRRAGRTAADHPYTDLGQMDSEFCRPLKDWTATRWCSAPCKRWQTVASP